MFPSDTDFPELISESSERRTTATGELSTDEKAKLKLERSREYRRRYKQRQKEKDELLHAQVEATAMEVERLRLEQAALIGQSHALSSLCTYSNSMIESLTAAAAASAAKARSLAGKVIEGGKIFRGWAKDQFLVLPSVPELIGGSFHMPSDDQMRWYCNSLRPEEHFFKLNAFIDRLTHLMEEGKRCPEAQKYTELKINYIVSLWCRGNIIMHKERFQVLEDLVCTYHLKSLRDRAAAGQYVRPKMLQNGPSELAGSVGLTPEQKDKLEEHWKAFVQDIRTARSILGRYTSKAADGVEATLETGEYTPASSADAAKCYLLAMDAANASDEFLRTEGRALIKLYISSIQVLTPMQIALLLTSCRPLVAHLPDICSMLLDSDNNTNQPAIATEGQGFSITDVDKLY